MFAFSIENFKRSKTEVDTLMKLADDKLKAMVSSDKEIVDKYDVQVRVLGKLSLLPEYVQQSAKKAMEYSRDKKRYNFLFINKSMID